MAEPHEGLMVTANVRLVRPLGEGGMGRVWVAEHQSLRTNVVVKFLAKELADSPEAIARFSREAAAASQVKSPHVVQTLDHGFLEGGAPYIVMELLEGEDLEQHLKETGGNLAPREVVAIVMQLARALAKAHERGIVHRDIKPSNVFLLDAGGGELFVKLLDFGIAKGAALGPGSTTRSGTFVGSPYYMSPEQIVGARDVDFRSDLWSLGVVAFEALTGRKPFVADTLGALALKIHRDPLPVPTTMQGDLPTAVDAWFARACAREPGERFASAREMADGLAAALLGEVVVAPTSDSGPKPQEVHALAATLRSEGPGSGPRRSAAPARTLWRWALGGIAVVGTASLFLTRGLSSERRSDPKAEPATLHEESPRPLAASALPLPPAFATPSPSPEASLAPAPAPSSSASPLPSLAPSRAPAPAPAPNRHARAVAATPRGSASARPNDDDIK